VVAFGFNGVQPIESNMDFVAEAKAAAGGRNILTLCEAGGTMKPTVNFPQVCFLAQQAPGSLAELAAGRMQLQV
jgi:hypothetical protein